MSKNLAIIGASYLQLPLIEKAKAMGYTTHVFAWKADDVGETAADVFHPISIVEKDQILQVCRQIGICGICSIASDLAAITVNYVAWQLGLPCNRPEAVRKSTNKHAMRLAFECGGDPSPRSFLITELSQLAELSIAYPAIVKPTDRSGSRGITKLEAPDGLADAVSAAMAQSFEKSALVEEYASGQEYSVECISFGGKHTFLAMTKKYTTGAPHFIETGHMEPAPVDEATLSRVIDVVKHALDTLGIENGASHSELKIDDKGTIRLIEIGGRMGGDGIGSHLVRYSTGYDFVRMVIDTAVGSAPDFTPVCTPRAVRCSFILTPEDLAAFRRLQAEDPAAILDVIDLHPENIGKTTDSSNRAGCYIHLAEPVSG